MPALSTAKLAALAVPYVVVVAILYLVGFWSPLGLNPLEFIGLEHVAIRAAFPLLALILSLLLGAALSQLLLLRILPAGGGANSRLGQAGRRYWHLLVALILMMVWISIHVLPEPGRWYVGALLISLLGIPLSHLPYLVRLVPSPSLRGFILLQLLAIPAIAYAEGRFEAYFIWRDSSRLMLDVPRSGLSLQYDAKNPVIFIGRLGDYFVFGETLTHTIVITQPKDAAPPYFLMRRLDG
jgi:hypothetical protein